MAAMSARIPAVTGTSLGSWLGHAAALQPAIKQSNETDTLLVQKRTKGRSTLSLDVTAVYAVLYYAQQYL
jgi:hypothetical protein